MLRCESVNSLKQFQVRRRDEFVVHCRRCETHPRRVSEIAYEPRFQVFRILCSITCEQRRVEIAESPDDEVPVNCADVQHLLCLGKPLLNLIVDTREIGDEFSLPIFLPKEFGDPPKLPTNNAATIRSDFHLLEPRQRLVCLTENVVENEPVVVEFFSVRMFKVRNEFVA